MAREELIEGAVTFLQDPSVSSAPIEQKLSFLRSKNLTHEEIDASLARAGQPPTASSTSAPPSTYQPQYRQPQQQHGYQQQYPPYWNQPPPEPPHRDWRDWFIMATITAGVGSALWWTAKRYIVPLIAPPTPPQLEQDKASIDASFEKTFALLDQLATDTKELKDSEAERKERLDKALGEVESVISKMKEANESREQEAKRWGREMDEVREQIPQAIAKEKEAMDGRLKDLAGEVKSLKTLVANRMGQPQRPSFGPQSGGGMNGVSPSGGSTPMPEMNGAVNGVPNGAANGGMNGSAVAEEPEKPAAPQQPAAPSPLPERSASASPYSSRMLGGKAQIPAWQLAAKKRADDAKKDAATNGTSVQDVSESGTAAPAEGEAAA
ncbi:peroxisomal membrane protein pex14 [Saxophila tyrrhenica]|uniref:Peroxisomal membrane protein PEX14 n=1 Tax=Saxophila tyrrhenica TaxID=1690608 RepID=A0AAV9P9J5_9PEZI|nr:peroxisomal membrane protein pex14 [Saxophila tyrrhenica]